MELVIDFLLLAASGTATLYCWVLSKKLKALTNAEAGLGAGIAALSQSANEMKTAVDGARASADETVARIEILLSQADEKAVQIESLLEQLSEMSASVGEHAENATKRYLETLTPFLAEASETADRLMDAVAKAGEAEAVATARADRAKKREKALAAVNGTAKKHDDFFVIDEGKPIAPKKRARTGAAA